jgi:hypothetical protein
MAAELAGVVLEPAPSAAPPACPPGAAELLVLEGPGPTGPCRWLIAELEPRADAASVRDTLAAGERPRVAFTARPMGGRASAAFDPDHVTHVMPVPIPVPEAHLEDVDRWYEEEHTELLLRCHDWLRVRRFAVEAVEGPAWTRLALHDLASPEVLATPQLRAAMATPWRDRLAGHDWFMAEGRVPLAVRR